MSNPLMIAGMLIMTIGVVEAQEPPPARVQGQLAPAVEIAMNSKNDGVDCKPRHVRLPAGEPVDLRLSNHADRTQIFFAKQFFQGGKFLQRGASLNLDRGEVSVAPGKTARIVLQVPEAGEYRYTCRWLGSLSPPQSIGLIVVQRIGKD